MLLKMNFFFCVNLLRLLLHNVFFFETFKTFLKIDSAILKIPNMRDFKTIVNGYQQI